MKQRIHQTQTMPPTTMSMGKKMCACMRLPPTHVFSLPITFTVYTPYNLIVTNERQQLCTSDTHTQKTKQSHFYSVAHCNEMFIFNLSHVIKLFILFIYTLYNIHNTYTSQDWLRMCGALVRCVRILRSCGVKRIHCIHDSPRPEIRINEARMWSDRAKTELAMLCHHFYFLILCCPA